jgi:hypothetical protein
MSARHITFMILCLVLIIVTPAGAQTGRATHTPVMVALMIEGGIDFARAGWTVSQPLVAGTLLNVNDVIFPNPGATLLVMCPDGSAREFLPSELMPNDIVDCRLDPSMYIVGDMGTRHAIIQRGGRQDPTIPYLITPRATVVRESHVKLRWNAVQDVEYYMVTVRGGGGIWQSNKLGPEDVVQDGLASLEPPITLQEDTPYTVDICVLFEDMREGCTTDPGWSSGDVAFYYHPNPALDQAEERLIAGLGENTPEALYARAVLLGQPLFETPSGVSIGVYDEAVALLERITEEYPESALAESPELYNLLGEWYRRVALPLSAARAYEQAADLAAPDTEAAARAALGRAITTPAGNEVALYSEALDDYEAFLSEDAFTERFADICAQAGGLCLQLPQCDDRLGECAQWAQGGG